MYEVDIKLATVEFMDSKNYFCFRGECKECGTINTPYPQEVEVVDEVNRVYTSFCNRCDKELRVIGVGKD